MTLSTTQPDAVKELREALAECRDTQYQHVPLSDKIRTAAFFFDTASRLLPALLDELERLRAEKRENGFHASIPVTIDGKMYSSIREASAALGLSWSETKIRAGLPGK